MFDKRIELLEALALAVKLKDKTITKEEAEDIDFVEYNDLPYVNELLEKIDLKKYPELKSYILDNENCGSYTNLYLCFDNEFNYKGNCEPDTFSTKNANDFAALVKKIYDAENIEQVFQKYSSFLIKISSLFNNLYQFNEPKVKNEFSLLFNVPENVAFDYKITMLANGGFSSLDDHDVIWVKGIGEDLSILEHKRESIIVNLYHEYAHYFVNPIVDKNFELIPNKEYLFQEAIENGLPKVYQNINSMFCEYFVRAISVIYAKDKTSSKNIETGINWFKDIGFVRVEDIITIIENGMKNSKSFEDILKTDLCQYFANVDKNFGSSQRTRN